MYLTVPPGMVAEAPTCGHIVTYSRSHHFFPLLLQVLSRVGENEAGERVEFLGFPGISRSGGPPKMVVFSTGPCTAWF